ncbi:hypothetical protein [Nocardioides sp. ChNu-99]|uniref:hypothetical protein n=1 Tax=Nocardioides sp. ChNu-99 TaxID=2839897 RepID=UPI002405087E|nr:hypothetical protein [Nocardioides sp. ChNu-99]MDF9718031.1 hypothetical protein [Nocardioides sp. ChNu-99]
MPDQPSLTDVVRRLDEQAKATERVIEKVDALVNKLSDDYVPRREYDLRTGALEEKERASAAFRRQVMAGALVGLVVYIITVFVLAPGVPS